jgi:hypothetical protein
VVRWPGVVPAGSKNGDLVSNLDFASTSTAAGVAPAEMQGKPLQSLLRGELGRPIAKVFYYRYYELGSDVGTHEAVVTADSGKLIHYTAKLKTAERKREAIRRTGGSHRPGRAGSRR